MVQFQVSLLALEGNGFLALEGNAKTLELLISLFPGGEKKIYIYNLYIYVGLPSYQELT